MKNKIKFSIVFMLMAVTLQLQGAPYDAKAILPKLQANLSKAKSSQDSLPTLYDIYDVTPRDEKFKVAQQIFWPAHRAGDLDAQLDIIRLQGGLTRDQRQLQRILRFTEKLPMTHEQQETVVFLKMRLMSYHIRCSDSTLQDKELTELVHKIDASGSKRQDPHDQLLNLFAMTNYLRMNPDSKLLLEYLDTMVNLVNSTNYRLYALRNNVYSEASSIYSDAGLHEKAIETNRKLLEIIDGLEKKYHDQGRKYREYDVARFVAYRRMLRNYQALTLPEVEEIYGICRAIENRSPEVAFTQKDIPSTTAYYHMARKEYAEAIPLLKRCVEHERSVIIRSQMLDMLRTAAKATGDSVTLAMAESQYAADRKILQEQADSQKYHELRVAYELNQLKAKNAELKAENAEAETKAIRHTMGFMIAAWILVAILLVVLLYYWSRYRHNAEHLAGFARMLTTQRDRLKYNRYGEYDHDPYLSPVTENSSHLRTHDARQLLQSILSDILYISAIGHDDRMKHIAPISINTILGDALKDARPSLADPNDIHIDYANPDFNIITDPECLRYIVSHIMIFAEQHSPDGKVNLKIKHLQDSGIFYVIFTHGGERIPAGQEEILFKNFVDWDEMRNIENSALLTCRLISFLLKCNISYNPHTEGDPRLVLTVPIRVTERNSKRLQRNVPNVR